MTDGIIPAPLAQLPWRLLLLVIALGGFGTIVLYSAAGGSFTPWAQSHLMRFSMFLVMAILMSRLRISFWREIAFPLYGVVLLLLLGVELLGAISGGSQRWLDLGIIRLQPSELMKLAIILAVARFYDMLPSGEISGPDDHLSRLSRHPAT
jgi:rod shape determining protein RodA